MLTANKIPAERSLNEPICRECARFPLSDDGFPFGILDSGLQTSHLVLSQLQPHFIFNVLNMIYYMIGKEPNTARRMLDDFSSYLRSNIGVLDSPTPVSLEAEISHVNLYLRFEQMRYVDRFRVEYDLGAMDFKLPPLTLQPLVETPSGTGFSLWTRAAWCGSNPPRSRTATSFGSATTESAVSPKRPRAGKAFRPSVPASRR